MLTVRERVAAVSGVSGVTSGKSIPGPASGADGRPNRSGLRVLSKKKLVEGAGAGVDESVVPEFDTSVGVRGSAENVASCVNSTLHDNVDDRCATDLTAAGAAGRTAASTAVVVAGSVLDDGRSRRAAGRDCSGCCRSACVSVMVQIFHL